MKHMMNSLLESLLGTRIINFNGYLKTLHGSKYNRKYLFNVISPFLNIFQV